MANYKKLKQEAWKYYKTWMKEETFSPALNAEVNITNKGWDHLVNKNTSGSRTLKDKINRLTLLKKAKFIINNSKVYKIEKRNNESFYIIKSDHKKEEIRVIIKRNQDNKFVFFSVMKH